MLKEFEVEPQKIMNCVEQEWPESKIIEALHIPAIPYPQPAWDYGADLPYVIAYFKSQLAVLIAAEKEHHYVLHAQS